MRAFTRAVWQANRWIVVVGAAKARRAVAVVAGFWIDAVGFFTNEAIGRAIELVVTRWGWLTHTIGAIRAIRAFAWTGTTVGRSTGPFYTFAASVLAAGYRIAVAIVDAAAQVVGVKTFVVRVAKPLAGALLIEITGGRWRVAGAGLSIANLSAGAIAAVVGRVTVIIGEASAFDALLPNRTVIIGCTIRDADSFGAGVIGRSAGVLAVFVSWTVAVIGAWSVFFRLHGLAGAAHANPSIAVIIAHAEAGGVAWVRGLGGIIWVSADGATLTAGTECADQYEAGKFLKVS